MMNSALSHLSQASKLGSNLAGNSLKTSAFGGRKCGFTIFKSSISLQNEEIERPLSWWLLRESFHILVEIAQEHADLRVWKATYCAGLAG